RLARHGQARMGNREGMVVSRVDDRTKPGATMSEQGQDRDRWLRIKELFGEAAARPPAERTRFLADECPDDAAMRHEVEALLASHDEAGDVFEHRPPAGSALARAGIAAPGVVYLAAGRRLGPYEIVEIIGAGGMGEVYRAKDTTLGRDVALKVLPESFVHDSSRVDRFRREAQVLASLNHPHIGAIYGFEAGDVRALVLELVEGPTLAERIASGPLPIQEALRIAAQIADALEAA